LSLTLGKAELIDLPGDVADVLAADSAIVDVMAIQSNRLYAVGLAVGDTNLIVLDANGDVLKRLDIHVSYDLQAIQVLVDDLFPTESVKIGAIHDQILLTGKVSTPEKASRVVNLVGHYVSDLQDESKTPDELVANMLDVRGKQQVMLQVKILEATRSVLKELGIETYANDPNELSATTVFGRNPNNSNLDGTDTLDFATGAGIALSQDPTGIFGGAVDTGLKGIGLLGFEINALEEESLVNILAEPNLTAISGEQAGFLAGGEFPVPVGRDQVGNLVIEYKEFGVSLNFRPFVLSDKRISLQMNTEVSSLDFENAITLADIQVPGLDVRRTDTTVEIASGGSLMIAGLLQSDALENMAGLPGLSDTPILGDLVSSDGFRRNETELVVIVTPYLVEPYEETERAEPVIPRQKTHELANAFAANIRRNFDFDDEALFAHDQPFGYILD
jgi:pilus assembly protein CpaC